MSSKQSIEFGDERLPVHFWRKARVNSETGCWEWTASKNHFGYGAFWWNAQSRGAHRVAYHELVGEIPDGLHLDHLCRVRHCCNPEHLEPVTQRLNVLRGKVGTQVRYNARYSADDPTDWSPYHDEENS